jgi:segregation and condensation protein B
MAEFPTIKQILEGAILAADGPLSIDLMIQLFEGEQPSRAEVRQALKEIEDSCEGRGFELKAVASGYRFQVRKEYAEWVSRLWEERPQRYSRALLETLALIAYKQPLTRGDIEEVRGVAVSTNIIRTLLEREWIRVVSHRDVPGRPALYATTKYFLDYFNLTSLDELPTLSEIKDLGKVNEELDLEEEVVEARVIELEDVVQFAPDPVSDEELDQVTADVNLIEDNIRTLFPDPNSVEDAEEDLEVDDELAAEVALEAEEDPAQTQEPVEQQEQFSNVPQEIMDAAFQEDDQDDSKT